MSDYQNENEAIIEFARDNVGATIHTIEGLGTSAPVMTLPRNVAIHSVRKLLEEYLPRPERREGTTQLHDLDSFVEFSNRFSDEESAIFANEGSDGGSPRLTAIFDYHQHGPGGLPRWGKHRAEYVFPLSPEWVAWTRATAIMDQKAFAEFLEDRILDVLPSSLVGESTSQKCTELGLVLASPEKVMELARNLTLRVDSRVKTGVNLSTGESQIVYEETHSQNEYGGTMKVPNGFVIGIPVFLNGPLYQLPVRLRYRVTNGAIRWTVQVVRAEVSFRDAFREACESARTRTGLPLFYARV